MSKPTISQGEFIKKPETKTRLLLKKIKCLLYGHKWAYNKWLEDSDQSEYLCTRCLSKDKV